MLASTLDTVQVAGTQRCVLISTVAKTKFISSTSAKQFADSCEQRNSFLKSPAMEVSFFLSAQSDKLLQLLLEKPNVARCLTLANVGSVVR